ncbi:hypothetical protein HDU86_008062 [Geranomyces michiganensis]|nr:hypothetical protein HDU86_008062 [Geranomyces michiganensis]
MLEIYQMELKYDGLYTMVHLGSCRIPRRIEDMCLLPPVIGALLFVKARILASIKEHTRRHESDDLELHLSSGPPSDEEFDAEGFARARLPTPKRVKKGPVLTNFL